MYILYNHCKYIHYPPAILLLNRQIFYLMGRPGMVCLLFRASSRQMMRPGTLMLRRCSMSYTKKADHHGQPFI